MSPIAPGDRPHIAPTPDTAVYVARQPILDRQGRTFGYELLYRAAATATSCTAAGDAEAARVFSDAVLAHGLERLTQGHAAFINLTAPLLCSDAATLLPASATVLELREDIVVNQPVLDACQRLHELGYRLALDDFDERSDAVQLLPYATFVKIDVLATSKERQAAIIKQLAPRRIQLVAEKVETADGAAEAMALGYHHFQGYYFCRPATVTTRSLPASRLACLKLLAMLNRPDLSVSTLEDIVKRDPSMCYRVLRSANSAALGARSEIRSVRQALVMIGLARIQKWASVWVLAGVNAASASETVAVAVIRARCCELIGQALSREAGADFFLLGLCSLLDALLGQPLPLALEGLPLSSGVRDALLGGSNLARRVLDAVIAYERGSWDEVTESARGLGLPPTIFSAAYTDALGWADELSRTAKAA